MKIQVILLFSLFTIHYSLTRAQDTTRASLTDSTAKKALQGVWAGPDESYYFLFRGDSVKEWESDGADSSVKPFCSYGVSKIACDSLSAHLTRTTGFFMTLLCHSTDYDETRCYFIQSLNADTLQLGVKGKFDESGLLVKVKVKSEE